MFSIFKRGTGKNWQISYKINGIRIQKTTKTGLFCQAVFMCNLLKDEIESTKRTEESRKSMGVQYNLAERIIAGRSKPRDSVDGFDRFYLDIKDVPTNCMDGLGAVYVIKSGTLVKIGISQSPRARLRSIVTGSGRNIEIIYLSKQCANFREAEMSAHALFGEYRLRGEWFEIKFSDVIYYLHKIQFEAPEPEDRLDVLRRAADNLCIPT